MAEVPGYLLRLADVLKGGLSNHFDRRWSSRRGHSHFGHVSPEAFGREASNQAVEVTF